MREEREEGATSTGRSINPINQFNQSIPSVTSVNQPTTPIAHRRLHQHAIPLRTERLHMPRRQGRAALPLVPALPQQGEGVGAPLLLPLPLPLLLLLLVMGDGGGKVD